MFIHHIATLVLIMMSYVTNHVRIGCLIILVHDSADYLLEVSVKAFYLCAVLWKKFKGVVVLLYSSFYHGLLCDMIVFELSLIDVKFKVIN